MTPEDMKKAWRNSAGKIRLSGCGDVDRMSDLSVFGKQTSLQRLSRNYIRFSRVSLFMCFFSLVFIHFDIFPPEVRVLLTFLLCIYFATASVMDYWLYIKTSSIDVFTMRVGEVAAIARRCRRRHHQFMLVLLPFAMVIFGMFIYFPFKEGDSVWVGAVVGGAFGGAIGLRKYLQMMRDYRRLSEEDLEKEE